MIALFNKLRLLTRSRPNPDGIGHADFPLTFPEPVADHVRQSYAEADSIIEYGSGGSTRLAAERGVPCLSVESDKAWAEALARKLRGRFGDQLSTCVMHVGIGPTKAWGYPTDASQWDRYWHYPTDPWMVDRHPAPSHVLIDGRMRKACFAATLLNITRETTILFDDYTDRPAYHVVEEIVAPRRFVGRMAEFVVTPGMVDNHHFQKLIPWFFDLQ